MKYLCCILFTGIIMFSEHLAAQDNVSRIALWTGNNARSTAWMAHYPCGGKGFHGAVLVCPGGGYSGLSMDSEGSQVALFFNSVGMDAFVLRYSLNPRVEKPQGIGSLPLEEASRAIRLIRANSSKWQLDEKKIGVIGFSAGGHLASTLGTHFDAGDPRSADPAERASSRPDYMMLIYPVITFAENFTHRGSRDNLLGKQPDPALVDAYSNERQVTGDTPPAFIVHAHDDGVSPLNSIVFYTALQQKKVPAELHIYSTGGHGFGLGRTKGGPAVAQWTERLKDWLQRSGYLP